MNKYQKQLVNNFIGFVDDDSPIKEYNLYEFPENYILIRLFTYNPEIKEGEGIITDFEGTKTTSEAEFRLIPYGKVLANTVGPTDWYTALAPGDMISVPDELSGVQINPKWVQFKELMKERPAPMTTYEPPQLLGKIQAWERYAFSGAKLKEDRDENDFYTFLIPHSFITAKVNKNALKKTAKSLVSASKVKMATSNKS